jgi:methylase of polypeptide subunit release factors
MSSDLLPISFDSREDQRLRLTHYLFRYPAKFHPPVARALIDKYSEPGQTIFDPFCGSGTSAVESLATGRNAVGMDIDPVAIAVATAKTRRLPSIVGERRLCSGRDVLRERWLAPLARRVRQVSAPCET